MRMLIGLGKLGIGVISSTKAPACASVRCMSTAQVATAAPVLCDKPSTTSEPPHIVLPGPCAWSLSGLQVQQKGNHCTFNDILNGEADFLLGSPEWGPGLVCPAAYHENRHAGDLLELNELFFAGWLSGISGAHGTEAGAAAASARASPLQVPVPGAVDRGRHPAEAQALHGGRGGQWRADCVSLPDHMLEPLPDAAGWATGDIL